MYENDFWKTEKKLELYKRYMEEGPEWAKFAKDFKKSKESLRSVFRKTNWDAFFKASGIDKEKINKKFETIKKDNPESVEEKFNILIESRKQRIQEDADKRKLKEYIDRIAKEDLIYEKIISAISQVPLIKPPVIDLKRKYETSPQEAIMIVSDAHIGLAVLPEEVGGLNSYNVDIFIKRLKRYIDAVLRITELHRTTHRIDTLHIPILGDLVHGMNDVGKWGFLHSEQNIIDQIFRCMTEFNKMLIILSQAYKSIKVYGVYGNHGRMAKRGIEKRFVNWDYLIYRWMEQSLSLYKNIEFSIPRSPFQVMQAMGKKFLLSHGDTARSWNGIPWYGLTRLESQYRSILDGNKAIDKMWEAMKEAGIEEDADIKQKMEFAFNYVRSFDYMIIGHFHSMGEIDTNSGGKIIMNSSFIGGDDYSINDLVSCSLPCQKFFGVNRHGKTWSYDIELDRE